MYIRPIMDTIQKRLEEPRRFIQVLAGPRQVGKTTLANQAAKASGLAFHYATADDPGFNDKIWLQQQWDIARLITQQNKTSAILILDEIQKIPDWSSMVKYLWDADTLAGLPLQVIILGSAALLIQKGLAESLAGRFEMIPITHWSFTEMQEAFAWSLDQYIYFGGYPGAAPLISEETRWKQYIIDSLIEATLSKDILSITPIQKPALLRELFYLSCSYSGQILSYQKMTGQLHDAGNTTTLAHYLELLSGAGLVTGISKFAGQIVRQRASSPKLQVMNTALMSAQLKYSFSQAKQTPTCWGRLLESAIGAYLLNSVKHSAIKVYYWRQGNVEVDFILQYGDEIIGLEVKSSLRKGSLSGMSVFHKAFNPKRILLIGGQGISPENFLKNPVKDLFL